MQAGIEKILGVKPGIIKDTQTAAAGEIIIGSTSRTVSGVSLRDNEYCVYTDGGRLVIQAGKSPLLTTAANKFLDAVRLSEDIGDEVPEIRGTVSDFDSVKTVSGVAYSYVWGDEFNASSLDTSVWSFKGVGEYGVAADVKMLTDENCITSYGGNLHMKTIQYTDSDNSTVKFASPWSITTDKSMNYAYGYLEIRAKVPVVQGSWGSFWLSTGNLNGKTYPYGVEVDVFETQSMLMTPNLHKWYRDSEGSLVDIPYNGSPQSKYHDLSGSSKKIRSFTASDTFRDEYHIIGFLWTTKKIVLSVDGNEYMTFNLTDDYEAYSYTGNTNNGMSGFHNPMAVILGSGIYSPRYVKPYNTWAEKYMIKSMSVLPFDYTVDYIRLYQKSDGGELITN